MQAGLTSEQGSIATRNAPIGNGISPKDLEAKLVHQARAGEKDAFSKLFDSCRATLYGLVYIITKNHEDTEDALQNTALKAYKKLSQFREDARFSSWVARIAINEALMNLRRQGRAKQISLEEAVESQEHALPLYTGDTHFDPEMAFQREEILELLIRAVGSLPPKYHKAFFLTQVRGCTSGEAAKKLDLPVATVKARVHRARKQVRDMLGPNREALAC